MAESEIDLTDQIIANASGPKKVTGDQGSIEQHSLADMIEADRYKRSNDAASSGLGIRHVKLIPPGAY